MRVTQNMLASTVLNNISSSYERIAKYQTQLASGKLYHRPSDNPVAVNHALATRTAIKEIQQYADNLDDGLMWLGTADVSLRNATELLYRAKELAVMGANATNSQSELDKIANEVDQLLSEMVVIGNTTLAGRYIFGGHETMSQPFTQVTLPAPAVTYNGDAGSISYEIEKGVTASVNLNGNTVFQGTTDVFQVLIDLSAHLRAGDYAAVSGDTSLVDDALGAITDALAIVGSKINRMEFIRDRHEQDKLSLTEILSNIEDADLAEVVMKLKSEENVYQSALMTGSMTIQKSLIDFLR